MDDPGSLPTERNDSETSASAAPRRKAHPLAETSKQSPQAKVQKGDAPPPGDSSSPLEKRLIFLVGAIQFVNVLDFMMVMPLGPDFAEALGIDTSHIGLVGGVYTAAAAVAGIIGSLFLDRFDRKKALTIAMLGLALGTAAGGFAQGLPSLLLSRIVAGAFGGPATSLSLAIITDAVPPARRGKALGAVMAAFSVASVLGVPAGLELSRRFGFRSPFFVLAGVGLVITVLATRMMPSMTAHLSRTRSPGFLPTFDRLTLISLTNTVCVMIGVFSIVPNLSAFVQYNLGYPREMLGVLYLIGGAASFVTMRLVGILVDRFGAVPLVVLGTLFHVAALDLFFLHPQELVPIAVVFTLYMLSGSVRMVPMQTLATQVPSPDERARYMSAQSAVQHMASALGAFLGSLLLFARPDGTLVGMEKIAIGALILACAVPFLIFALERGLQARNA